MSHGKISTEAAYVNAISGDIRERLQAFYSSFLDFVKKSEDQITTATSDTSSFTPETMADKYMEYFLKRRQRFCILEGNENSSLRPTTPKEDPYGNPSKYYAQRRGKKVNQNETMNRDNAAAENITTDQSILNIEQNNTSDSDGDFSARSPKRDRHGKQRSAIVASNENKVIHKSGSGNTRQRKKSKLNESAELGNKEPSSDHSELQPAEAASKSHALQSSTSKPAEPRQSTEIAQIKSRQSTPQPPQSTPQPPQSTPQPPQSTPQLPQSTPLLPQSTLQPPQSTPQPPQSTLQPPQSTLQPPQSTLQPPQSTPQLPQSPPQEAPTHTLPSPQATLSSEVSPQPAENAPLPLSNSTQTRSRQPAEDEIEIELRRPQKRRRTERTSSHNHYTGGDPFAETPPILDDMEPPQQDDSDTESNTSEHVTYGKEDAVFHFPNIWREKRIIQENTVVRASQLGEMLKRIGSKSGYVGSSIRSIPHLALKLTEDRTRKEHQSSHIPYEVEGKPIPDGFGITVIWKLWSQRMEFNQDNRTGNDTWMESKVIMPEHTHPFRTEMTETKYNSFKDYTRLWMAISVYVIYAELSDISGKWENWHEAETYDRPCFVNRDDPYSAYVTFLSLRDRDAVENTINLSRYARAGQSHFLWRQYDIVMVDLWRSSGPKRRNRTLACTLLGIVIECNSTHERPEDEWEKMESSIMICGISSKTLFGHDMDHGQFTAIVRKLGYIGSSVRGFSAIQNLKNCDGEVKEFLCAARCCQEGTGYSVEERIKPFHDRQSNTTLGLVLWRVKGYAIDYLHRFSSKDASLKQIQDVYGRLNHSQLCAVVRLLIRLPTAHKLSLIERTMVMIGPAGTGKTSTLGHAIGALFNTAPYLEPAIEAETLRRKLVTVATRETKDVARED